MGYERNERGRYGDDRQGGNRQYGGADRGYDRGRPSGFDEDRGFFDRAGDEVRSWFGDEEAERRRRYDERYDDRFGRDERGRYGSGGSRDDARFGGSDTRHGGYGRQAYGQGYGQGDRGQSGFGGNDAGRGTSHEPSYRSWRDRQMESFDRDYEDYRRENQSRFDSEFHTYRTKRQGQRDLLGQVREHQEVIGSDDQHIGTVDHVRGDRLRLTKTDQAAGGHHHSIPSSWIESVDDRVRISKTADEAKRAWREEADEQKDRGGLFGQRDDGDRGQGNDWSSGRNLNRSFSGTY